MKLQRSRIHGDAAWVIPEFHGKVKQKISVWLIKKSRRKRKSSGLPCEPGSHTEL